MIKQAILDSIIKYNGITGESARILFDGKSLDSVMRLVNDPENAERAETTIIEDYGYSNEKIANAPESIPMLRSMIEHGAGEFTSSLKRMSDKEFKDWMRRQENGEMVDLTKFGNPNIYVFALVSAMVSGMGSSDPVEQKRAEMLYRSKIIENIASHGFSLDAMVSGLRRYEKSHTEAEILKTPNFMQTQAILEEKHDEIEKNGNNVYADLFELASKLGKRANPDEPLTDKQKKQIRKFMLIRHIHPYEMAIAIRDRAGLMQNMHLERDPIRFNKDSFSGSPEEQVFNGLHVIRDFVKEMHEERISRLNAEKENDQDGMDMDGINK